MKRSDDGGVTIDSSGVVRSVQPGVMRSQNLATVLRVILARGPLARAEIVGLTGISTGTVTKLTATALAAGVLVEHPEDASSLGGRPRVPLGLNPDGPVALAAHLGPAGTTVAAVNLAGTPVIRQDLPRPDPPESWPELAAGLAELRDGLGGRTVLGVGVTGATRTDVWAVLADQLGLPVEQDEPVRGLALAELMYGVGRRAGNVLTVLVDEAVGAAFVTHRQLYRGETGLAGTVTHLPVPRARGPRCTCGRTNCFGTIASNAGVTKIATERGLLGPTDPADALERRAEAGDPAARELLRQRATWVGHALALLDDLLDPAVTVVTGSAVRWTGFLPAVRTSLARHAAGAATAAARLSATSLPPPATVTGAAALVLDRHFRDPLGQAPEVYQ